MWRFWPLFGLLILAGCGGNFESKVVGTWKVDPATVKFSRLTAGAEAKPEGANATQTLGQLQVRFGEDHTVKADGFGTTSAAKWKLIGTVLDIEATNETWPHMMFDPKGLRIDATIVHGNDKLEMSLVKE